MLELIYINRLDYLARRRVSSPPPKSDPLRMSDLAAALEEGRRRRQARSAKSKLRS